MAASISNTNNTSISSIANQATSTTTSRGTPIVQAGQDMDKNAFLKILSAELSNQDPENSQNSTQYVSQMAQFSSLEQMANLNTTMRFVGANSLIGRQVTLDKTDDNGNLYSGEVKNVVRDGDNIKVNVIVGTQKDSNGNIVNNTQEFGLDDISEIGNSTSSNATSANTLTSTSTLNS